MSTTQTPAVTPRPSPCSFTRSTTSQQPEGGASAHSRGPAPLRSARAALRSTLLVATEYGAASLESR